MRHADAAAREKAASEASSSGAQPIELQASGAPRIEVGSSEIGPSGPGPGGGIRGRLFVWLQYVLPQHGLSRLVLLATRVRAPWFKNLLTRGFLRLFAVDMSEAVEPDPYRYRSFNEFFTRALRPDARPIDPDPDAIVSPADGAVSECGMLEHDKLIQAKGRDYRVGDLLAGHAWARSFEGGSFATIYLAPFNYHRVHMAIRGSLFDTVYVPGRLFSVNTVTAQYVPNLFARNERVLTLFETDFGRFALVMVGALNVGSIATVWAGDITPGLATSGAVLPEVVAPAATPRGRARAAGRAVTRIPSSAVTLDKGDELGRFNMGSTVILLFEPNRAQWHPLLRAGSVVQLGQAIGRRVRSGTGQRPTAGLG